MKKHNLLAKINGDFEMEITPQDIDALDLVAGADGQFHVLQDGKSYQVNLMTADFLNKSITLEVNGSEYTVELLDSFDRLVDRLGLAKSASVKIDAIEAPMPGLVLDVMVAPGDTIEKGTPLAILEAMKMENVIKAPGEAKVQSIEVEKGQSVEKGQILIRLE
jgi:biotin carboxyl carrier protein